MDFSIPSLFAGFVFGVMGVYILKQGKKRGDLPWIGIGVALIVYPYFFANPFLLWGIGFAFLGVAYRFR